MRPPAIAPSLRSARGRARRRPACARAPRSRSPRRWSRLGWVGWLRVALLVLAGALGLGCRRSEAGDPTASSAMAPRLPPESMLPARPPEQRVGMAWIPPGALVVGAAPGSWPRAADRDLPGEQVVLGGFHIDVFPYPNEAGAIPMTNVTRDQATALCEEAGKRLCTELEWERACKGPANRVHEYGDVYRADRCGTGVPALLRPTGIRVGCQSDFGVRDLHGGIFEWTAGPFSRGLGPELGTLRGGNGEPGELFGRCAHAEPRAVDRPSGTVGFRCCAGTASPAAVQLPVVRGPKLVTRAVDRELTRKLLAALDPAAREALSEPERYHFDRAWTWRPIGNEEIIIVGGCRGLARRPACGLLMGRRALAGPELLAWASSGSFAPQMHAERDPLHLWLFGGDDKGTFHQRVDYDWGRVHLGGKTRRPPRGRDARPE